MLYYILSLNHTTRSMPCVWWGPERRGYTRYLDEAGQYTADQLRVLTPHSTLRAVPVEVARSRAVEAEPEYAGTEMRRPGALVVPYIQFRHLARSPSVVAAGAPCVGGAR